MTFSRDRPEILTPPGHPPACCTQKQCRGVPVCAGSDVTEFENAQEPGPSGRGRVGSGSGG